MLLSKGIRQWTFNRTDPAVVHEEWSTNFPDAQGVTVEATRTESWHAQLLRLALDLEPGRPYLLRFRARSNQKRATATLHIQKDQEPWDAESLSEPIVLTTDWKTFVFPFKASSQTLRNHSQIALHLGLAKGTMWISDASLTDVKPPGGNRK